MGKQNFFTTIHVLFHSLLVSLACQVCQEELVGIDSTLKLKGWQGTTLDLIHKWSVFSIALCQQHLSCLKENKIIQDFWDN